MSRPAASPRAVAAARGAVPADLLLTGGRVFVPTTKEWIATDLAICDGVVVGWGPRDAVETVDVGGAALTAGFVDAHMHLESTKLWVDEFVRSVLPHGTTAVAADPHEIANVFGVPGVVALAEAAAALPFTFGVCASSCVPASPFESPGAELGAADVRGLLDEHGAIGVAEVMNFPGVIAGDPDLVAKIDAAGSRRVDGHAPGLARRAARRLPRGRDRVRPRVHRARRSRGEAPQGDVGLHPGGLGEPEPGRPRSRWCCATAPRHVALCSDDREPDLILDPRPRRRLRAARGASTA